MREKTSDFYGTLISICHLDLLINLIKKEKKFVDSYYGHDVCLLKITIFKDLKPMRVNKFYICLIW